MGKYELLFFVTKNFFFESLNGEYCLYLKLDVTFIL